MKKKLGMLLDNRMGENALRILRALGLVDYSCEFQRAEHTLLVPLAREPSINEAAQLRKEIGEVKTQVANFVDTSERPKDLASYLNGRVPNELVARLPRSFDMIGDIAVIELSEELARFSSVVGQGILKVNPQARLVLKKSSTITGPYRKRGFDVLAGVGGTETVYREFSCRYRLDVSKVYFNPRLSHERQRVAKQVKKAELVVDMFAGVGPYSILAAKLQPQSVIYSVDVNPAAVKYLKENAFVNSVADRVIPLLGDVKQFARKELCRLADRVIMNFPSDASNYLSAASQILKEKGGAVHFYTFASQEDSTETVRNSFTAALAAEQKRVKSFGFCKVIKEVSPKQVEIAIDAVIE